MPKYWMISNRVEDGQGLGNIRAPLTFWESDGGDPADLRNWKKVDQDRFKLDLIGAASQFPAIGPERNEDQKHVTFFVHGYNNSWQAAAATYECISRNLFEGQDGMGICVLFSWPSDGVYLGYYPDRQTAEASAPDLSLVLNQLYDWLLAQQAAAIVNPSQACVAKTSLIAHSMGNYLLQKAMQYTWTHKYQPLLVSLINQLVMVAADVDNDLFKSGESVDKSDGDAIANLTYRVTALYTGRDSLLGLSAGLKHFGKRRLGRSGLDRTVQPPDNVWDVDCTNLIPPDVMVHTAYFDSPKTIELIRQLLRGVDRTVLMRQGAGLA